MRVDSVRPSLALSRSRTERAVLLVYREIYIQLFHNPSSWRSKQNSGQEMNNTPRGNQHRTLFLLFTPAEHFDLFFVGFRHLLPSTKLFSGEAGSCGGSARCPCGVSRVCCIAAPSDGIAKAAKKVEKRN